MCPSLFYSAFKDPRFSGRPRALQKVMSALFASSSVGGTSNEEKNGGIVFRYTNACTFNFEVDFNFGAILK